MRNAGVHFVTTFRRLVTGPFLMLVWVPAALVVWAAVGVRPMPVPAPLGREWGSAFAVVHLAIFATAVGLLARGNVGLPVPTLPVAPRARALAESAAAVLVLVLPLLALVIPLSVMRAGEPLAAVVQVLGVAWIMFPFVACADFADRESLFFTPLFLAAVVALLMSTLGVPVWSHPFATGAMLLVVVVVIGPRWNDVLRWGRWQSHATAVGRMWRPALPLAQTLRREAFAGALACAFFGLVCWILVEVAAVVLLWANGILDRFRLADIPGQASLFIFALSWSPFTRRVVGMGWKFPSPYATLLIPPDRIARALLLQFVLFLAAFVGIFATMGLVLLTYGVDVERLDNYFRLTLGAAALLNAPMMTGFPRTRTGWVVFGLASALMASVFEGATPIVLLLASAVTLITVPSCLPRRWELTERLASAAPWLTTTRFG